jgi:isocitrate dehydrogenase
VHGSAPDIAGKDVANPSGLLWAATQMLVHLGFAETAESIKNAWLSTLEAGIHTADVHREGLSSRRVGTWDFADAVIERLGERPTRLTPVSYRSGGIAIEPPPEHTVSKALVGVDVFCDWSEPGRDPAALGRGLEAAAPDGWQLKMITNRGVKVYPNGLPETFRTDHWRCRFVPAAGGPTDFSAVLDLLGALHGHGYEVIKTEHLYDIDGAPAYSLGQGE